MYDFDCRIQKYLNILRTLLLITLTKLAPGQQHSGQLYERSRLLILRSTHFSSFYISLLHHRNRYYTLYFCFLQQAATMKWNRTIKTFWCGRQGEKKRIPSEPLAAVWEGECIWSLVPLDMYMTLVFVNNPCFVIPMKAANIKSLRYGNMLEEGSQHFYPICVTG